MVIQSTKWLHIGEMNITQDKDHLRISTKKSRTDNVDDDNRVSVIVVDIIHVANIDIRLKIVKK